MMGTAAGVAGWRSPAHVTLRRTVAKGDLLAAGRRRDSTLLIAAASRWHSTSVWLWTASLERTSVTSAVAGWRSPAHVTLRRTVAKGDPLLVAVASRLFLGEPMQRKVLAGIAVAMAGGVVIAVGDASREGELLGDLLAFLGAITIVGYLLAGRRLRGRL